MTLIDAIKQMQTVLGVTADGVWGPITQAALTQALHPGGPVIRSDSKTPWLDWFRARKGWTEFDHDKELSKGWPLVGLSGYHTVIGTEHAWCGMSLATALHEYGYRIPHGAAGAANWDNYGTRVYWQRDGIPEGAVVRIRHHGGGDHVTTADRHHDAGETFLDGLGGNQGNSINVSRFNVTGNAHGHDEIMWVGWPVLV